jgi:hypothetical protein
MLLAIRVEALEHGLALPHEDDLLDRLDVFLGSIF